MLQCGTIQSLNKSQIRHPASNAIQFRMKSFHLSFPIVSATVRYGCTVCDTKNVFSLRSESTFSSVSDMEDSRTGFCFIKSCRFMRCSPRLPKDSICNIVVNMFWDRLFHTFTWLMTLTGVVLLFRALHSLVMENPGGVNHHILHPHHAIESQGQSVFDLLFLTSGLVLLADGLRFAPDQRA